MNLYVVYSGLLRVVVGKNITIDLLKFTLIQSKFVFLLYEINVFNCYNQIFQTQEKVDKRGKKYCLIGIKISSLRNSYIYKDIIYPDKIIINYFKMNFFN